MGSNIIRKRNMWFPEDRIKSAVMSNLDRLNSELIEDDHLVYGSNVPEMIISVYTVLMRDTSRA